MNFVIGVAQAFWLLASAGIANMAPILAARLLPALDFPLDGWRTWRGVRIFGDHKTVRGFVCAVLVGGSVYFLQTEVLVYWDLFKFLMPTAAHPLPAWFGFWMGFCAIAGDAVKSFFKRRLGLPPGARWVPFDQIDWALAAIAGAGPFVALTPPIIVSVLVIACGLSAICHAVGYWLGLNADVL